MVRLTKSQQERIKTDAETKGYSSISDYIRSLALEHDSAVIKKLDAIYENIVPKENGQKNKIKERLLEEFMYR